ncbi:hypothetical protein QJS10_CPB04g01295 [Acorus calamus]|uniref:Uncharacterized protein n=1 Tax=Acorus calamus TaxID=4465 RepID=A0AAV9F026_ACOCL|nr:hypothetical protein QJS10_CPB04g01295 [Acorus calamus]
MAVWHRIGELCVVEGVVGLSAIWSIVAAGNAGCSGGIGEGEGLRFGGGGEGLFVSSSYERERRRGREAGVGEGEASGL